MKPSPVRGPCVALLSSLVLFGGCSSEDRGTTRVEQSSSWCGGSDGGTSAGGTPFGGAPIALPATFTAVSFDVGGEGVSYHDLTPGNQGGQFRTSEDVDIILSSDPAGGGYAIDSFQTGEWLDYTVSVTAGGTYDLAINASTNYASPSAFHVEVDGVNVTGSVPVPPTGDWNVFHWVGAQGIPLAAGIHVLRLFADAEYFNVDALRVSASAASPPPTTTSTRAVTNPQVLFDGTELDLGKYSPKIDDPNSSIDVVPDPLGAKGSVIRFREAKQNTGWDHVMLRPYDKRTNYQQTAQLLPYEKAYHFTVNMQVPHDPQYSSAYVNLLEDFHCEPCEANNMQVYANLEANDSLCMMITYSTDPSFDPRGTARGSSFDPWPTLNANRVVLPVAADGTTSPPAGLASSGELVLCRDDLHVSDLFGRWIQFEMLVRPSSYATGVVRMWIDGKPYFYLGPNSYRWNQLETTSPATAVNNFQFGLYLNTVTPQAGTPNYFDLYTTAPRIEIGDDVQYAP